jgi:hypothetical protein
VRSAPESPADCTEGIAPGGHEHEAAASFARNEKAPATRAGYLTEFAMFRAWCENKGVSATPGEPRDGRGRSRRRAAPRLEGIERLERAAPPADSSKAPAPKKTDSKAEAASTPIMVLADAMADWLAYGLEIAYADSRGIGIVRQARTNSGPIRAQVHNDPEYPDWPQAAREVIAAQHPKFVVMMVGVNDRKQIRKQVAPPHPVAKLAPEPADKAALEPDRSALDRSETPAIPAPETTFPRGDRAIELAKRRKCSRCQFHHILRIANQRITTDSALHPFVTNFLTRLPWQSNCNRTACT